MKNDNTIEPSTQYIFGLDGLRALAVGLVVLSHLGLNNILPGGFGVTLFFFISGFLITRLMIAEYTLTNSVSIKKFYVRRILRLYPTLLIAILGIFIIQLIANCYIEVTSFLSALFYFANYYHIYFDSVHNIPCEHFFDVFWSLSVEEHFYLFYPVLFSLFYRRKKAFVILLIIICIIVLFWRTFISLRYGIGEFVETRTYHGTDTRIDSIIFGCLSSVILNVDRKNRMLKIIEHRMVVFIALGALLCSFLLFSIFKISLFRTTVSYSIQGLSLFVLIPNILFSKKTASLRNFLNASIFSYIGKLSYGIYLYHWVCLQATTIYYKQYSLCWYVVAILATTITSICSYEFIEKKISKLRKQFGSNVKDGGVIKT
ncbi:MAG TPA: acyltransferase [Chitinophagaceae bacterium]|nr:acyltransferase [Chitinophagaceae bacterium]